uniref:Uncharacterized protein n=1 Tax=Arundo donax TaxID=35708 RepID=A0A0A9CE10_ARUDO
MISFFRLGNNHHASNTIKHITTIAQSLRDIFPVFFVVPKVAINLSNCHPIANSLFTASAHFM